MIPTTPPIPRPPPTEYRIKARATADGPAVVDAAGVHIGLDAGWGRAPTGDPGPAELLAAAFAACLLKNLARTRELLGFRYDAAEVRRPRGHVRPTRACTALGQNRRNTPKGTRKHLGSRRGRAPTPAFT